jgi:hypothetical protein
MARTRRGPRTQADAYVAGRTEPTAGIAQPSASPTGHPVVSLTGHQSCRGTPAAETKEWGIRRDLMLSVTKHYVFDKNLGQVPANRDNPGLKEFSFSYEQRCAFEIDISHGERYGFSDP